LKKNAFTLLQHFSCATGVACDSTMFQMFAVVVGGFKWQDILMPLMMFRVY
jgi:hydrogenase maturation factor